MKTESSKLKAVLLLTALNLPAIFGSAVCSAQVASPSQQTNATEPMQVESSSTQQQKDGFSATSQTKASEPQYTQSPDCMSLQEIIEVYNKRYCPPEKPIEEITDFTMARLVKVEMIKRTDLDRYRDLVMINGKVYTKKDPKDGDQQPEPKPLGKAGKNLLGDLKVACEQLEQKQTRGESDGNKKPEQILELKRRRITYRDKENQLREMEVYSPPKFPAKKKPLAGKKGKKVPDYATSILVPKNQQGNSKDISAFDSMPSADAWVDDNEAKSSK